MARSLQVHWSTEQRVEEGLSSGICHRKRWKCEQRWHCAYILQGNNPEILKKLLLVKSTFWLVPITYFVLQDGCLLGMNICNVSLFTLWNTNVWFLAAWISSQQYNSCRSKKMWEFGVIWEHQGHTAKGFRVYFFVLVVFWHHPWCLLSSGFTAIKNLQNIYLLMMNSPLLGFSNVILFFLVIHRVKTESYLSLPHFVLHISLYFYI